MPTKEQSEDDVMRAGFSTLREWLARYDDAVAYLNSNGTTVGACRDAIVARDYFGALIKADGMREALAHCDELLAALKAMVASYDGIRDSLTCPTIIAKLAAADAAIQKAEAHS